MKNTLSAILFFFALYPAQGQTIILSDDLEGGIGAWTLAGDLAPNFWVLDDCAGNGATNGGSSSLYISNGSAGCGATGNEAYSYSNSAAGNLTSIIYHPVNSGCLGGLSLTFDYKNEAVDDIGELIYSTDNGATWIAFGSTISGISPWSTTTEALPAPLAGVSFLLGFRFTYNTAVNTLSPMAVDNITLTGLDGSDPTILCPSMLANYVDASCSAQLIDYTGLAIATDGCPGIVTVTQSPAAGSPFNVNDTPLITLTATDLAGNQSQCSFTQTFTDTISPTISCPGTQSISMNTDCEGIVGDYVSLSSSADNCSAFGSLITIQAPPAGQVIGASTTVFLTTTDASGNFSSCSFSLLANDNIVPTITCPVTQTLGTTAACDYNLIDLSGLVTGADNCSLAGALTYSQSPVPGTLIPLGTQQITITVEDEGTNTAFCSFDILIEDQEAPTISICAPNQTVIASSNCDGDILDYTSLITANDNCSASGNITYTQSPAAGTTISATTLITITAEDEAGNTVDCQFSALISDTTSPVVNCPADMSLAVNSSCQYILPDITGAVTGTDNCSVFGNMTVTQNPPSGATATGISPILMTLIDEQGNLGTCITTINPIDNAAPTVTCPTVLPVDNGSSCDYILPNYGALTLVLDNCPDFTIIQTPAIGTVVNPGITPITILVTDAGGNTETCLFDLSVTENVNPTIVCPSNISTCDPLVIYSEPTFADNCASALSQIDVTGLSSGDVFPVGTSILQYEVADSSGNTQGCSFFIEIFDFPSAAIITEDTIKVCDATSMILDADPLTSGSGIWTVLSGQGNFNNEFSNTTGANGLGTGENVFVWTVSSATCGTLSDTVVVIVNSAPIGTNIPIDTMFACNNETIDLITGVPINGTGLWSSNTGNIISDPTSNLTTASLASNGWHLFTWSVSNDACGATIDTMFVYSSIADTINIMDTTVCSSLDASLFISAGSPSSEQSVFWEDIGNNVLFDSPFSETTNASGFNFGTNIITYTISSPNCPDVSDTLIVISTLCDGDEYVFPTVITPNFDGKNDLFIINHLEKVYPDIHVVIFNRWGSVVYESIGYDLPWDGTRDGEKLPMGTYFYKINLNDSDNTQFKGDISIIH